MDRFSLIDADNIAAESIEQERLNIRAGLSYSTHSAKVDSWLRRAEYALIGIFCLCPSLGGNYRIISRATWHKYRPLYLLFWSQRNVRDVFCSKSSRQSNTNISFNIKPTRHNSVDSVPTSNLVCIKEIAIRTTFYCWTNSLHLQLSY